VAKLLKWAVVALVALIVIGAATGGVSNSGSSSSPPPPVSSSEPCTYTAAGDCTPRVAQGHHVRVDALEWSVDDVATARTVGDPSSGAGATADGTFVMVKLRVRSRHDQPVTISDNVVKLEIGPTTYDANTDAETALTLAPGGLQPFEARNVGPDIATSGVVVFDVPTSKLHRRMSLRFGELGVGPTHGYIDLAPLSSDSASGASLNGPDY
jgi:hypothetical protein